MEMSGAGDVCGCLGMSIIWQAWKALQAWKAFQAWKALLALLAWAWQARMGRCEAGVCVSGVDGVAGVCVSGEDGEV